jgi:hypothetical protein
MQIREQSYQHRDPPMGSYLRRSVCSTRYCSRSHSIRYGIFHKPITEYRGDRDRHAYEESNAEAFEAANAKSDQTSQSRSKSDGESVMDSASSTTSKRKAISAGQLAGAFTMSIVMFAPKALKGLAVDIPLATKSGIALSKTLVLRKKNAQLAQCCVRGSDKYLTSPLQILYFATKWPQT